MSVQRIVNTDGTVRFKARVKSGGRQVATRRFERRTEAIAWEREQVQRLSRGDWIDPSRGRVTLAFIAEGWLTTRSSVKRRTRETDESNWRVHIAPTFASRPVTSITTAEVSEWAARLVASGRSPATVKRSLATLRSILSHAQADDRLLRNVAQNAVVPKGRDRREGQALTWAELVALAAACRAPDNDVVVFLGNTGLRWGELAGLQVGDLFDMPAPGVRLQRAVLAAGGSGELFVDALKSYKARTVPLTQAAAVIAHRRAAGRAPRDWLFSTAGGGALREGNWKRAVGWTNAKRAIDRPTLRVHDLRHTAASLWLAGGADPKVVQRILGHASATMTMDLYGHLIDDNLWEAARRVGDQLGTALHRGSGGL